MIATDTRRLTVEDYRRLPEDDWRYQLIDGEIVMSPSPSFFHQTILLNLSDILSPHVRKRNLGKVRFAPLDFYLDDNNVYQPDILFISRARESIIQEDGLHGAPDFVVEVLSPRTARYDFNAKRSGYARSGVGELWLVYPKATRVDVFHLQENAETPVASYSLGQTFQSPLFPDLDICTDEIFAE
ncbi:MAG: Uma2 family endonuclease [Chthoniobacterales bacterium]|nr:Uma2 family endonuclease [Chthoniobacterales bacterium]